MDTPKLPTATIRTMNGGIHTGFYVGPDPLHHVHVFVSETYTGEARPLLVEFDRTLSLNVHPDVTYSAYHAEYYGLTNNIF